MKHLGFAVLFCVWIIGCIKLIGDAATGFPAMLIGLVCIVICYSISNHKGER